MHPHKFRMPAALWTALFLILVAPAAQAQFKEVESDKGVRYGDSQVIRYQCGVVIEAVGGPCRGLYATIPVPLEWPEQEVRIVDEDVSPQVRKLDYRTVEGGVKQMLVNIPVLGAGQEAKALITFELRRRAALAPQDTSIYEIPTSRRETREIQAYLGDSPYIESRHRKIRSLARQLQSQASEASDWKQVETIYDHVRKIVEYKNGPLKGALAALNDGTGDCEEMTSLFIALCRANKIPARTVWVHGHCYPEFYLVDDEKQGHWFPCQAAGSRAFGEMPDLRPILQKGDNFRVEEKPKERQRYVAEFLKGLPVPGGGKPRVKFVRQIVK